MSHGRLTAAAADGAARDPYLAALTAAGARFRLAPASLSGAEAADLLASASALLLCGGVDVDPAGYGHEIRPECGPTDSQRDAREKALIEAALAHGLPLLAICRGIQMLNVALGGTLYQDIPTEVPGALRHKVVDGVDRGAAAHSVDITSGSVLATVLGCRQPAVNSRHHQALWDVASSLTVVGRAPDGIAEAVEIRDHRFAFGVQWHPEDMVASQEHATRLFRAFVVAASPGSRA